VSRMVLVVALVSLLACATAAGASPSLLGPTGLILIPTAETTGMGGFSLGAAAVQMEEGNDASFLYGNVGLPAGLEVGATREKVEGADAETLVNAKLAFFRPPLGDLTLAAGMIDVTDQIDRSPYVVLTHTLGAGVMTSVGPVALPQIHVGVGGGMVDGLFAGVSTTISRKVGVMAEYDGEQFNFGARVPLAANAEATVAALDGLENLAAGISFSTPW